MATFSIESNGRLEKTAIYYNGEQMGGVKEIFINIDEEGTFDAIIQYEGSDSNIYNKQIFEDFLVNAKIVEPSFSEEEAAELRILTIESDGTLDNTVVFVNDEELNGIVSLMVHIVGTKNKSGLRSLFSNKKDLSEEPQFKAEITFRNEDDSIETEDIF